MSAGASDRASEPARRRWWRRPHPEDVGEDPDPRFTLANQRTFLAWNRTALALVGGGLAVVQFVRFDLGGARLVIALPLIVLGGVLGVTSLRHWEENERCLRLGLPLPVTRLPRLLAAGTALLALGAAILVVVTVVR